MLDCLKSCCREWVEETSVAAAGRHARTSSRVPPSLLKILILMIPLHPRIKCNTKKNVFSLLQRRSTVPRGSATIVLQTRAFETDH